MEGKQRDFKQSVGFMMLCLTIGAGMAPAKDWIKEGYAAAMDAYTIANENKRRITAIEKTVENNKNRLDRVEKHISVLEKDRPIM